MFGWSRPKTDVSPGLIRYDVHNHVLPGVDDGAPNAEAAFECIEVLVGLGYQGAVVTPHIYREVYENQEPELREAFSVFEIKAKQEFPEFQLQLGAEYLLDEQFLEKLYHDPGRLLAFGADRRRLLIEFSGLVEPLNAQEVFDECRRQQIQPVLAHIERYPFVSVTSAGRCLQDWRAGGACLQMNLGSLVGQYGATVRRKARFLWRHGWVDLLGTDMHRPRRMKPLLSKAWAYIRKRATNFDPSRHHELFPDTQSGDGV